MNTLGRLKDRIEAEGSPLSDSLVSRVPDDVFTTLAEAGQRSAADPAAYALALESAFEGYLAHFGDARLLGTADGDMRLLAGDYLYALGFLELAKAGDTQAIEDLAELIAVCAALHSGPGSPDPTRLELAWGLTALAITAGRWSGLSAARSQLVDGWPDAEAGPSGDLATRVEELGLTLQFEAALIAFRGAATGRLRDT